MPKLMKVYSVGDKVLLELTVAKVEFDDSGRIKYQLKDERSKSRLGWNYRDEDLLPAKPKRKPKAKAADEKKDPASKKTAAKKKEE